jgi:hypothetical protein
MVKSVARKVMWVGKATVFMVGLAVVLALTVGVSTTALAGTGIGATFNLGQTNTVDAISKLVGSIAGPSLQIDNNSTGTGATALDLQVEPGKAPMTVNSGVKVANLNADEIDGQDAADLEGLSDVRARSIDVSTKAGANGFGTARCAPGEVATGGGVDMLSGSAKKIFYFEPGGKPVGNPPVGWDAAWFAEADTVVRVHVVCAS